MLLYIILDHISGSCFVGESLSRLSVYLDVNEAGE